MEKKLCTRKWMAAVIMIAAFCAAGFLIGRNVTASNYKAAAKEI